ncbi:hypothetical protein OH76DRAFT_1247088 [Lentinus brumalis]|uniref:Uncharacterized protein n=1 Tax=Lentinus brumalis TaxID=2498619 RepID=A0A371CRZ1_9APHY|nr:hypothetical protein OH76DRAFT_1247088 [Polyporus brumalis]
MFWSHGSLTERLLSPKEDLDYTTPFTYAYQTDENIYAWFERLEDALRLRQLGRGMSACRAAEGSTLCHRETCYALLVRVKPTTSTVDQDPVPAGCSGWYIHKSSSIKSCPSATAIGTSPCSSRPTRRSQQLWARYTRPRTTDLTMMATLGRKERTLREFMDLPAASGWQISNVTRPMGSLWA